MIDVFIKVYKTNPSDSWQRILTYENEKHLKESVEAISNHEDVLNVEVFPIPDRENKSYNEAIKEYFNAHRTTKKTNNS